eukprot:jgi/Astpho2/5597/fgenesh1_pg.00079_%23_53_t
MPCHAAKVFEAMQGQWLSSCLGVLLDLHIPEILSSAPKPLDIEEVAKQADASPQGTDHLYKVLRTCAQWELLVELPGKKFAANAATSAMVRDGPPSLGHLAAHQINKPKQQAWQMLPEAVKAGQTAFMMAHNGENMYQYCEHKANANFALEFNKSMTYFTQHSLEGGQYTLRSAFDWSRTRVVMDVGGGQGELLSRAMLYAGNQCKGVLLDRPHGTFEAKGVTSAAQRLQRIPADVMQPFPQAIQEAGVDTLLMKHFLSAFSDSQADTILKHCAQALSMHGKLLLMQTLVPNAGDTANNVCKDGVMPGLFSIEILAMCPGGAWRTLDEWKELFGKQGFKLEDVKEIGASMHLMVWGR